MRTCKNCNDSWQDDDLNADGVCKICFGIADPNRSPLTVFGHATADGYNDRTVLRAEGAAIVLTGLTGRNGEHKVFPIERIADFDLSPPKWRSPGSIRMKTTEKLSRNLFDLSDPISFRFLLANSSEFPYAQNIQKYITEFKINPPAANAPPTPQISVADELIKLKSLLNDGVLTQEEFDRKKNKLLGE